MGTLRELLNRLRWDPHTTVAPVVIVIRVREGATEGVAEIGFMSVVDILPGGVTVAGGTFLPYHRVISVRRGEEVLWLSSQA